MFDGSSAFRLRGFGRHASPPQGPITISKLHPPHPNQPFRPLPPPTGRLPFHLSLDSVLDPATLSHLTTSNTLAFHIMGDVGGIKSPESQQIVADHLEQDIQDAHTGARPVPAFLYLLGDIVYYYGAASEYRPQFYDPYVHYSAPILAIPGNHDGDVDPHDPQATLEAFVANFCAAAPGITPQAGESTREAMTQPNVYWTLEAPFVTVVGLYTNVPEGGQLDPHQIEWLQSELASAPTDKALLLTMHHPMFSGDVYHSGSQYMQNVVDSAVQQAGRIPDAVFAGHVHDYQRYTRLVGRRQVPYIVAGAGGYWNLHPMANNNGQPLTTPFNAGPGLTLESFNDTRHGFMRVEVSATQLRGAYYTVPKPSETISQPATLFDSFTLDLKNHTVNAAGGPVGRGTNRARGPARASPNRASPGTRRAGSR